LAGRLSWQIVIVLQFMFASRNIWVSRLQANVELSVLVLKALIITCHNLRPVAAT
jgi:hypothetical protein